jgi:hypothetical protein
MLQTYEAMLEPDGRLQFLEEMPEPFAEKRRVLVTFTQPAGRADPPQGDWRVLAGSLKGSPNLNGDPLVIQQELRHEWD